MKTSAKDFGLAVGP